MTAFNADNFRGKLSRLSESSQSIQTLSGWIQYHKKHAVESAEVWAKETLVADPERQLLYIYLANDVMQHSRRKKTEQVKTFGGHMKAVLPAAYAAAPESVRSKLLRMLSIWEERQILSTPEISAMRAGVSGGAPPAVSAAAAAAADDGAEIEVDVGGSPAGASGVAGGVELKEWLAVVEESGTADELENTRDESLDLDALESDEPEGPEAVAAAQTKAAAAVALLTSQRDTLQAELLARQKLILVLATSVEKQHMVAASVGAAVSDVAAMLERAEGVAATLDAQKASMDALAAEAAAEL